MSDSGPRPSGPKDATSADPPSAEAAASDQPSRTPGLGHGVPPLDHDQPFDQQRDQQEDQ